MLTFIKQCLKYYGVKCVFKQENVESEISFYQIVFKNRYDEFCYLKIFYNDADLFIIENRRSSYFLGNSETINSQGDSLISKIINSIEVFDNLEECNKRFMKVTKLVIDKQIDNYLEKLKSRIESIIVDGLSIVDIKVYKSPCFILIINYIIDDNYKIPLKCFIGQPIHPNSEQLKEPKTLEFINAVNNLIS